MHFVSLPLAGTFAAWRHAMRRLMAADVAPSDVEWAFNRPSDDLFASEPLPTGLGKTFVTSRAFMALAEAVICHKNPERFALLHFALIAMRQNRSVLDDSAEPTVARLRAMEKSVRRDCHKMTAFVRFKETGGEETGRRRFFAWFEPEHFIVERTAIFFARRFGDMDWTIATPAATAHFDAGELSFAPGAAQPPPVDDEADALWRIYYASIFNPARLKVKAMTSEMPKKYWNNLPEATLIPGLIAAAQRRASEMIMAQPAEESLRARKMKERQMLLAGTERHAAMADVKRQALGCTRCPLHCHATQTVFGEGPDDADIMFVGEQPGDQEDLQARPFVGPTGQLFGELLIEAGIDRSRAYITNAVKHFKFELRGTFRLHKKPNAGEIQACKWWIDAERAILKPKLIVALGATAAQSLTGDGQAILKRRGQFEALPDGVPLLITLHPSALLRIPDADAAAAARAHFNRDLQLAAQRLSEIQMAI
jgi:uracil-DNA glycosylase